MRDAKEYAERFGEAADADDVREILADFFGDQAVDTISEITQLPLSMEDLYFEVIKQSRQPVSQLGNETMMQNAIGPLTSCYGGQGNTQYINPRMPAYTTKTKTVTYTAQQFFTHRTEYNTGRKKSCVKQSHGRIQCATHNVKYINEGYWATGLASSKISLPTQAAAVLQYQGTVQKRVTVRVSKFSGAKGKSYADFELGQTYGGGQWAYKKAGTYNTGWITYPASYTDPKLYVTQGWLGISPHTKITIDSVKIEYRYTVLH